MKLGLFGGTFDPIHIAHLIIAEIACDTLILDELLFMPCALPPHKNPFNLTNSDARLEMIQLAIADNPKLNYSDLEINRGGKSYTVNTLKILKERYNIEKSDFYMIIGADNFVEFNNWKDPEQIVELCQLVVVGRPPFDLKKSISKFHNAIIKLPIPLMEISSSNIRERLRNNNTIKYMVPNKVGEYIKKNKLYSF